MNAQQLNEVLSELMTASMQVSPSFKDSDIRSLIDKYDMIFMGKNINVINSLELRHSLKNYFKFEISNDDLNSLIPQCCEALNMKYESMVKLEDSPSSIPYCYLITLW